MFTVSRSVCWKLSATTPLHWSTLRLGPTPVYAGPQDSQWWWWFLFVFLPDLWYFWLCCISVVPSVAAMLRAVLGDCWLEWWSGGVPTCLPVVTQTRPRQHLSEREWTLARDEAMSSCQLSSHVTTGFHWFPPVITTLGREQSVSQSVCQSVMSSPSFGEFPVKQETTWCLPQIPEIPEIPCHVVWWGVSSEWPGVGGEYKYGISRSTWGEMVVVTLNPWIIPGFYYIVWPWTIKFPGKSNIQTC